MGRPRETFGFADLFMRVECRISFFSFLVLIGTGICATRLQGQSLAEAKALFDTGKYAQCLEMCEKGCEEYSWYESWRHQKLEAELVLGRYAEALATVEKGLKDFPSSIRLRYTGHQVYLHNDRRDDAERLLVELDAMIRQAPWRYNNSADKITVGEYFLHRGMDAREVLEICFDRVKTNSPTFLGTYLATGDLGLAKHDYAIAADAFQQAAKLEPGNPQVHYGLARAYESSEPEIAKTALSKALELNPRHVPSLLLAVDHLIDAEDYGKAKEILAKVREVNPIHPTACACSALLAHLDGNSKGEKEWREKALSSWSQNPEVDHLIGRKLSRKYRFAEGAQYQRQSLAFDPDYVPAKIQLSQDLLRLGKEAEGWQLAAAVSAEDNYNVLAYNLVTLRETINNFKTIESDAIVVRMGVQEAAVYGRAALELLAEAKRVLCEKYDIQIEGKVTVEIYPAQKDFAIRTFGMPGGADFLGVCFGPVITVNSPASQGESPSNWQAVLWHEFCHSVTLGKTNNKMPRWLSEGISVYEEKQANPAWGQSMNPLYRKMILGGELTPVSELSGAFLDPPSAAHLQFAYFESALVVEYLVEKHGLETLRKILDELAHDIPINAALDHHAGGLEALDRQFTQFAKEHAESLAPEADWEVPDFPPDASVEAVRHFLDQHPNNLPCLTLLARRLTAEKRWEEAKEPLHTLIALYPESASADSPYRLLGRVHRELGETDAEIAALEQLASLDADAGDVYLRLIEIYEAASDWEGLARNAERMLAVNPLIPAPHRALAESAKRLGTPQRAIQSYRALLQMEPIDPARMHFDLARLLSEQGVLVEAKRHVIMALEEAPRYRDAQKLLLNLVDRLQTNEDATPEAQQTVEVTP
jgi:tetratricopeptide (TPR) repeat protein